MGKTKKQRLNLYLSEDTIRFAKKWSYVTNTAISKMLEEYLQRQREIVTNITPFQWLNDPVINPNAQVEDAKIRNLEDYLNNKEEKEFCEKNPDHPRAKMRKVLLQEHQQYQRNTLEKQKENDKHLIARWMEVFHQDG